MTAKWLACVHRSLDEFLDNQPVYDRLKTMKIIPLATYQRESTSNSTIFFPLSENAELSYNGKYLCHSDNFGITVLSIHFANVSDLLCNDIISCIQMLIENNVHYDKVGFFGQKVERD